MPQITLQAAEGLSDAVKDAIRAQDGAIFAQQTLFASVIANARDAGLRFSDQQQLYATMHQTTGKLLDARWSFGDGLGMLRRIAPKVGAAEVLEGCVSHCPVSLDGGEAVADLASVTASSPTAPVA